MTLNVIEFGKQLVETGDLDPLYIMLTAARRKRVIDEVQLRKWCLAYWMFYHSGVATAMSEAPDFWRAVAAHVAVPAGARGTERRHFRGQKAIDAVKWLRVRYPDPLDAVFHVIPSKHPMFAEVSARVTVWPMFGPWIAWKVADMIDRVLKIPVDFSDTNLGVFEAPLKGACIVDYQRANAGTEWSDEWNGASDWMNAAERQAALERTLSYMTHELRDLLAPPFYDRPINIQELETCLCKYKSHLNGHYPVGNDINEAIHQLSRPVWRSALSVRLARCLPEVV